MFQGPSVFGIRSLNFWGVRFLDFTLFLLVIFDLEILPWDEYIEHEKSTIFCWYRCCFHVFFPIIQPFRVVASKILNNEAIG